MAQREEDVLSYALFPDIAKEFFLAREAERPAASTAVAPE